MMRKETLFLFIAFFCQPSFGGNPGKTLFTFSELPALPDSQGVEGAFAGIHHGVLIVAGGTHFHGTPWEGGQKTGLEAVYVMQKEARGNCRWIVKTFTLPRPVAYGVSISTEQGILCIGGCSADECYTDVIFLRWNPKTEEIETEEMPSLPRPLAFMTGAKIGSMVYIAGGLESIRHREATRNFWALDLSKKGSPNGFEWKALPSWPGPARIVPLSAVQNDGSGTCFYLFSGLHVKSGHVTEFLSDAYSYRPETGEWKKIGDLRINDQLRCAITGAATGIGAGHIAVFGGFREKRTPEDAGLASEIADPGGRSAPDGSRSDVKGRVIGTGAIISERDSLYENDPGCTRDILLYHTVTDTWVKWGEMPSGSPMATAIFRWDEDIIIPSGEAGPGIRAGRIWKIETHASYARFRKADYAVIAAYLFLMAGIGLYCSKNEKSTDDFFKAGQRIPWWAAGLSIFGTQLSAITFMAIPAKTFATDWRYFIGNMTIVACAPLVIAFFLPFYRRLNVTTAYEYIDRRFNAAVRLLASAMFILVQIARLGIVLFLPSIALSVVTGIDVRACILAMAVIAVLYTVAGGIEAVIWTDVVQVMIFMFGALFVIILIAFRIPGGWNSMNTIADSAGRLRLLDFRISLTDATFWVLLFGGTGANIISYGSDQAVIQRYLTTKDEKEAAKGIWTNAILVIPASMIFFGIGTALFAFYKTHPQALDPAMGKGDGIFPWFIVSQLPAGISGLLTAGLFAAAMSTLDSSMNSVATAFTTDFYRRVKPSAQDRKCLQVARWATVITGLSGMGTAFLLNAFGGQMSLWDHFNRLLGFFGGGLGGLFLLAIFTKRTHGTGALIGLFSSACVQYLVQHYYSLHAYCYTVSGIVSCFVIGSLASLVIPSKKKRIDGLTFHALKAGGAIR